MSAKFNWMLERELTGFRIPTKRLAPIIEDLDPFGWASRGRLRCDVLVTTGLCSTSTNLVGQMPRRMVRLRELESHGNNNSR
jgi:hypothetical protein